ncbi:GtrA family protein [Pseudalkalibacillus caeni]|uniref:GtrA family protein n=1 Tax=Exobacillus caeni TaxID=2574798 RepID=UPI001FE9211F|nr:GtrA family protein [Pseudalkalibacillus caeni]
MIQRIKRNKEILLYLLFGGLTTLVNLASYAASAYIFNLDYKISTTIAWIVSVLFAYFTNKRYVFNSRQSSLLKLGREIFSFFSFRAISYVLDIVTMILLVDFLLVNDFVSKVIANILVVVFNYVASKLFIFRK